MTTQANPISSDAITHAPGAHMIASCRMRTRAPTAEIVLLVAQGSSRDQSAPFPPLREPVRSRWGRSHPSRERGR
jgi:hypothetical protein